MIAFLGRPWAPLWSHGCFGLDLGRVWEALGRFLGGFGEDFERILGRFWEDIFVSETPALPRQLAWRHNEWGSLDPQSVGFLSINASLALAVELCSSSGGVAYPVG